MQKILVCSDGSEWSKKALNEAINIAQKFGIDCATVEEILKAEVEENLKKAQQILEERGGERRNFNFGRTDCGCYC